MVAIVFAILRAILYVKGMFERSVAQTKEFYATLTFQKLFAKVFASAIAVLALIEAFSTVDFGKAKAVVAIIAIAFTFMG